VSVVFIHSPSSLINIIPNVSLNLLFSPGPLAKADTPTFRTTPTFWLIQDDVGLSDTADDGSLKQQEQRGPAIANRR
jgi:hypothetical protein